jgi:hypothetical protein
MTYKNTVCIDAQDWEWECIHDWGELYELGEIGEIEILDTVGVEWYEGIEVGVPYAELIADD